MPTSVARVQSIGFVSISSQVREKGWEAEKSRARTGYAWVPVEKSSNLVNGVGTNGYLMI